MGNDNETVERIEFFLEHGIPSDVTSDEFQRVLQWQDLISRQRIEGWVEFYQSLQNERLREGFLWICCSTLLIKTSLEIMKGIAEAEIQKKVEQRLKNLKDDRTAAMSRVAVLEDQLLHVESRYEDLIGEAVLQTAVKTKLENDVELNPREREYALKKVTE